MESWIHLFSNFTSEALLFEALFICLLLAGYAAFWVLRKRRFGSLQQQVPSNVVKVYLAQLINEARLVRSQLFGLLDEAGAMPEGMQLQMIQATAPATSTTVPAANLSDEEMKAVAEKIANDPALQAKLVELQKKLNDQIQSTEKVVTEKKQVQDELEKLKAAGGALAKGASGDGADTNELAELRKKIKLLEDRLTEYSVIEDDLANLKRLQQENTELKAKLQGDGDNKQDPPAAAPTSNEEVSGEVKANSDAEAKTTPAKKEEQDPGFESLVDQVEDSLKAEEPKAEEPKAEEAKAEEPKAEEPKAEEPKAEEAKAEEPKAEEAKAEAPPTAAKSVKDESSKEKEKDDSAPIDNMGKEDDDLLSEFEKMLNM